MISYEEAREKVDRYYSKVVEYDDAWWFQPPGDCTQYDGGDQGRFVMKDSGEILRLNQYYFRNLEENHESEVRQ